LPKALVTIGGESLISRIHRLLTSLFGEVLVVSGNGEFIPDMPGATIVADEIAGIGPIGGLITALKHMKNDRAFCVACDMPFLDIDLIQHLVSLSDSREAVVPCVGRQIEPLHAVYSRACLEIAEERIKRRQYSLTGLILALNTRYVDIPVGPESLPLFNINTPQDLALAERIYANMERREKIIRLPRVLQ
jgi:molybdopterin-guanine dinucleotide biosynthesis protein A